MQTLITNSMDVGSCAIVSLALDNPTNSAALQLSVVQHVTYCERKWVEFKGAKTFLEVVAYMINLFHLSYLLGIKDLSLSFS